MSLICTINDHFTGAGTLMFSITIQSTKDEGPPKQAWRVLLGRGLDGDQQRKCTLICEEPLIGPLKDCKSGNVKMKLAGIS